MLLANSSGMCGWLEHLDWEAAAPSAGNTKCLGEKLQHSAGKGSTRSLTCAVSACTACLARQSCTPCRSTRTLRSYFLLRAGRVVHESMKLAALPAGPVWPHWVEVVEESCSVCHAVSAPCEANSSSDPAYPLGIHELELSHKHNRLCLAHAGLSMRCKTHLR